MFIYIVKIDDISLNGGGHHNLAKEPYKIITPKKVTYVVISSILFRKLDPFDLFSLLDILVCARCNFFQKPKNKCMKMSLGR
jgi:hypothetical protein